VRAKGQGIEVEMLVKYPWLLPVSIIFVIGFAVYVSLRLNHRDDGWWAFVWAWIYFGNVVATGIMWRSVVLRCIRKFRKELGTQSSRQGR
jgi:hypothetical protein